MPNDEEMIITSLRTPAVVMQKIDALADADDRSRNYLINKILVEYVEAHPQKPVARDSVQKS